MFLDFWIRDGMRKDSWLNFGNLYADLINFYLLCVCIACCHSQVFEICSLQGFIGYWMCWYLNSGFWFMWVKKHRKTNVYTLQAVIHL
jgi:hypothetical protein